MKKKTHIYFYLLCVLLGHSSKGLAKEFPASNLPPVPLKKTLIDMHTHVACQSENNGCYVNEKFKRHWKYKIYLKAFGTSEKELDQKGDEIIPQRLSDLIQSSQFVSKAVVLALDGFYDTQGNLDLEKTQVMVPNSFVLRQTQKHTNLLYAASIHPYRKTALADLEKAKSDGAIFIKWLPCIMGIDPESEDPRITAFYQKLIELNLPLLSHTGDEHSFMTSDDSLCDPHKLKKPLDMGVKVIAAHLGTLGHNHGESNLSHMEKLLADFPELKFDISSLVNLNKFNHIRYALNYSGRFYFGSDYPLIRVHLMGVPLTSAIYYNFKLSSPWVKYIRSLKNEFDQDVALKIALGVSPEDMEKSLQLLGK